MRLDRALTVTRVLLKSNEAPGDMLVLTAAFEAIAKFHAYKYTFKVQCCAPEIFQHNPHCSEFARPDRVIDVEHTPSWEADTRDARFISSYTEWLGDALGIKVRSAVTKPRIYLSPAELAAPRVIAEPYAVICSGYKPDGPLKNWGHGNWVAVSNWIQRQGLKVVQVGLAHHVHQRLPGAIDMIGKTNTRELFLLAFHSVYGCGHESYLSHIYAAYARPFACLAAGLCSRTWAAYATEQYVTRQGTMGCCRTGGCGKHKLLGAEDGCVYPDQVAGEGVPGCLARITPAEVIAAIEQWYAPGGVLNPETKAQLEVSFFRKGLHFAKALLKDVASGRQRVTEEELETRLGICQGCENFNAEKLVCNHPACGCQLLKKATWKTEKCPLGKWPAAAVEGAARVLPQAITVGTLYTPEMDVGAQAAALLTAYGARHGYPCVVEVGSLDPSREPHWSKPLLILKHFRERPACEWFFWVDADALIMQPATRLEPLLDDGCDFIVGDNAPHYRFNAGVFLIRRTPIAIAFLEAVAAHAGGLECQEQGAMIQLAERMPELRTKIIPRRLLNSFPDEYRRGDFIQHFSLQRWKLSAFAAALQEARSQSDTPKR
jgi:ADP-heptose:LPS heptosyltransferase